MIVTGILNFLQHLSSISTYTNKFVKKLNGTKTVLLDTRKTTNGLRILEKYATKIGGAKNHRMGLYDKILIKDNHIKVIGGISKTLSLIKKQKIINIRNIFSGMPYCHNAISYINDGSKYSLNYKISADYDHFLNYISRNNLNKKKLINSVQENIIIEFESKYG